MPRIVERPKARAELEDIAVLIAEHRPNAARRLLAKVAKLYDTLAAQPSLGSLWEHDDPRWAGVHYLPIPRYPKFVVFYRPLADGVEILHVFHGARELDILLEAEEP